MKQTVGNFDRTVRLLLGSLLVIIGVLGYAGFVELAWTGIGQALTAVLLVAIGAILLVTGATRYCLVYSLIGIDSMGRSKHEQEPPVEKTA